MRALLRGVLDLLAPPACARCRCGVSGDTLVCRACLAALPGWPPDRCLLCGLGRVPPGEASAPCAACRAAPPPVERLLAGAAYAGETTDWVHRFKYPRPGLLGLDPAPAALLRALAREAARGGGAPPDLVVPVPVHPTRLRERGFNPAWPLARAVAHAAGAPADARALVRLRATPSQTGLDRSARARNVAGAFGARPGARVPERVWLVDDVVTTGATLFAAARALRRAGARSVVGVCVARTPAPG